MLFYANSLIIPYPYTIPLPLAVRGMVRFGNMVSVVSFHFITTLLPFFTYTPLPMTSAGCALYVEFWIQNQGILIQKMSPLILCIPII
jgi:hypothetical protein